jgi:hypothetical protein
MRNKCLEQITLHILLHRAPVQQRHGFGLIFAAGVLVPSLKGQVIKTTEICAVSWEMERYCTGRSKCFRSFWRASAKQDRTYLSVRTVYGRRGVNTPFWREFLLLVREELVPLPSWITPCEWTREIALRPWGAFTTCGTWPVPIGFHRETSIRFQEREAIRSTARLFACRAQEGSAIRAGIAVDF